MLGEYSASLDLTPEQNINTVKIPVFLLCYSFGFSCPMCLLVLPVYFPVVCPLSPSVCQSCSLLVFSSVLLPLITSPGLLPPLSLLTCSSLVSSLFPFTPRQVIVCILYGFVSPRLPLLMYLLLSLFLSVPSSSWYVFLDFAFCFEFWFLICTLPFFLCTLLFRCSVATLFFRPCFVCFWVLSSALNKAHFLFFPNLASCLTAFGSTSFILSFPL